MQSRITELCNKCLDQTATEAERQELIQLLSTPGFEEEATLLLRTALERDKVLQPMTETSSASIIHAILQGTSITTDITELHKTSLTDIPVVPATTSNIPVGTITATPIRSLRQRTFKWIAAAAILCLIAGGYLWKQQHDRHELAQQKQLPADVQPGKEGAVLTLADGTQMVLDSLGNGLVATQNGSRIVLKDGKLAYDAASHSSEEVVYNTMTTPRGRQFNITLSDGTKVWLNAASSIRYPAVFSAGQREVAITGEAYFEVAKDPKRPFNININNKATAQVLGTEFNINAYEEETGIQATLLGGSLKIAAATSVLLIPGQQALIAQKPGELKAGTIVVLPATIEQVMAWRNGLFYFEGLPLQDAMQQLSRWYDIDIEYDNKGQGDDWQNTMLAGEIRRDLTLSNVLDLLKELGLHFRVEGKKLIVQP